MKMPIWMKKSIVVLLSIMTLGLVSPDDFYWFDEANATKADQKDTLENSIIDETELVSTDIFIDESKEEYIDERTRILEELCNMAEMNSFMKFGEKIGPKIEDEFSMVILPKIEEAIAAYVYECSDEELPYLAITENPSAGLGEKIFNIYNNETKENLILFHVRREKLPQDGHWFNFHYHTAADQFATHHPLGSIYWDHNTPPHWQGNISLI